MPRPKDGSPGNYPRGIDSPQGRKTHCPQGHEYNDENTYCHDGRRHCRTCRRDRNRENQRRARAKRTT